MMMKIEVADWDSVFFKKKIGKLILGDVNEFDPKTFQENANNEDFELIYIYSNNSELKWDKLLEAKLELVDTHLTMSQKLNREGNKRNEYLFRTNLTNDELVECYTIANEISTVSRFYYEKRIGSKRTEDLYKAWIDNALNKTFSDGLFLEKINDTIQGINLIKTDVINKIGYCTLIGVKSGNRRNGIGNKLWLQSFGYWSNESNVEFIKVTFSLRNIASFNFHLRMGFNRIENCKYIYHWKDARSDTF